MYPISPDYKIEIYILDIFGVVSKNNNRLLMFIKNMLVAGIS